MICVSTTMAPYVLDGAREYWDRWLYNAQLVKSFVPEQDVCYFAALEVDARGLKPYEDAGVLKAIKRVGGSWWTFSFNDGSREYATSNRVIRITMGQNITQHHAMIVGADWLCFLAADCAIPDDGLEAMLALDWPLCGLNVPTYCFKGPRRHKGLRTQYPPTWDVQEHINSAACLFMARKVFTRIKFRVDLDKGMTDDPCFHHDALALGYPTYVRHDKPAMHYPECIGAIETRHQERTIHH